MILGARLNSEIYRVRFGKIRCHLLNSTQAAFQVRVGMEYFWCLREDVEYLLQTKESQVWEAIINTKVLLHYGIPYEDVSLH